MTDSKADFQRPPRAVLIVALVLGIGAIGVILAIAATRHQPPKPLAIAAFPAPHAQDPPCRALLAALPQRLGDYQRAALAQPEPPGTAGWRTANDSEPVVLRCGLDRPPDFVVGSRFTKMTARPGTPSTGRSMWRSRCPRVRARRRSSSYPS
jgi:hypothetical protein